MAIKGIVLAGGTGSRLMPLTKVTNKHLLGIGQKPMIYYPIEKFISIGIEEILIVTGVEHMGDVVSLLGSGKNFECKFTYKVQDKAGGIAQALSLAENFIGDDLMVVILGDNIFQVNLKEYAQKFEQQKTGARLLLKQVPDPTRFGVAEVDGDKVINIEEKPKKPKSDFAVTGIYMYPFEVFELIKTLKPSDRGELEITDVNNYFVKKGKMKANFLKGFWTDAGTFESLFKASKLVKEKNHKSE